MYRAGTLRQSRLAGFGKADSPMPVPGAGAAQGSWIENTDAGCRAGQYDYAAALLVTADEAGCRSRGTAGRGHVMR